MPAEPSLRQRHLDRTRTALSDAALELFRERGFTATTVEDIASRADVATRTFFRYFPSKEAVLFQNVERKLALFRERLAERPAGEAPHLSLIAAFSGAAEDITSDRDHAALICRLSAEQPALVAEQRRVLVDGIGAAVAADLAARAGLPEPTVALRAQVAALMVCVATAVQAWAEAGAQGSIRSYVQEAIGGAAVLFAAAVAHLAKENRGEQNRDQ